MKRSAIRLELARATAVVFAALLAFAPLAPAFTVWAEDEVPAAEENVNVEGDSETNGTQAAKGAGETNDEVSQEPDAASNTGGVASSDAADDTTQGTTGDTTKNATGSTAQNATDDTSNKTTGDTADKTTGEGAQTSSEDTETVDITKETVTNVKYNEKTGILSWDPVKGAKRYYIYYEAKNIKNPEYSFLEGKSWKKTASLLYSTTNSYDLMNSDSFSKIFITCRSADYVFIVVANDQKKPNSHNSHEGKSASHHIDLREVAVNIVTYSYTYDKFDKVFSRESRRLGLGTGGNLLIDGNAVSRQKDSSDWGWWVYEAVTTGKTVNIEAEPYDGFVFLKMTVDSNKIKGATTKLTVNEDHTIKVEFERPLCLLETEGIDAESNNKDDIAQEILLSDSDACKWGAEGAVRMKLCTVKSSKLSDAEKDICKTERILRSKDMESGLYFDFSITKYAERKDPVEMDKAPKPVNIQLEIPDKLKSSNSSLKRTFYLVSIDNGEAAVIGSSTGDTLEGYISEAGRYMIGYADTYQASGTSSRGASRTTTTYTYAEPEPEEEEVVPTPEPVVEEPDVIEAEPEPEPEEEDSFPIGAAAAGTAAVAGAGGGIFILLRRIAQNSAE